MALKSLGTPVVQRYPWASFILKSSSMFSVSPSICVSAYSATELDFLRLFLLLLSLVNTKHLPTQTGRLLVKRSARLGTSARLAASDWSRRLFFPLLRGGGSEPLCPGLARS